MSTPDLAPAGSPAPVQEPAWVRPTVTEAALWLWRSYGERTATAYANHLGIPRPEQRWRPAGSRNQHHAGPSALAFFPYCLAAGLDPHTDMTREALQAWLTALEAAGVAAKTRQARFAAVSAWYREQRYQQNTRFEPDAALPRTLRRTAGILTTTPARPTTPLTMEQARALRVAAELDPGRCRLRNRALVAILVTTGIRAGEACVLSRGDVYPSGPDGRPALWITGKGNRRRWVRLTDPARAALHDYLAARDAANAGTEITVAGQVSARDHAAEPVFTTISGKPLEPQHVTGALRYLCRSLGRARSTSSRVRQAAATLRPIADTVHPHQVRHFYAVTAEHHGAGLRQISADLGHASTTTTTTYLDHGDTLAHSAAGTVADLLTAGENLVLLPQHDTDSAADSGGNREEGTQP